jgi:hypothetical protein
MNNKFSTTILLGILICLLIIALKPNNVQIPSPNANIDISSGEEILQLAPNRIAVVDNRSNSGMRGRILVFDFDSKTKSFNFAGTFNYADYFSNPQKYGIENN